MSNYSPIVSYGPKDSLAHGDPNKAIKGVQLDGEFNAIATAVSSKQDATLLNLNITGTANNPAIRAVGSFTTGQSYGVQVTAGTNASDSGLQVNNVSSAQLFQVRGDGHLFGAASLGLQEFTPQGGTFVSTMTGGATGPSSWGWMRIGPLAFIWPTGNVSGNTGLVHNDRINMTNWPSQLVVTSQHTINTPVQLGFSNPLSIQLVSSPGVWSWGFDSSPGTNNQGYTWSANAVVPFVIY